MCQFLSALVFRDGSFFCDPEHTDSHEDLIKARGLNDRDDHRLSKFVRVEFRPDDREDYDKLEKYKLRVDEPETPPWFGEDIANSITQSLRNLVERMIVTTDIELLLGGCWILTKGANVNVAKSSRIVQMRETSQVGEMWGTSQVGEMWGTSQVGEMWGTSQVGVMRETSQVGEMWGTSKVGVMRETSQVGVMRGTSKVGVMRETSQVGVMRGTSKVGVMRGTSQVGEMRGTSQVGEMWGTSKVGVMRETSQVGEMLGTSKAPKQPTTDYREQVAKV